MSNFPADEMQIDCIKFMLERPASGAFLDVGDGKTATTQSVLEILKSKDMFHGAIIITTLKILDGEVWQNEDKKWDFGFTYQSLHGKDKDKNLKKKADIYIMNFDGLPWLLKNLKHLKATTLIIDESDKAKGFKTGRFKTFKKILHKFSRRYLLSATPNTQSYMDLFSQIYILDEGERLGQYITAYRNKFFNPVGYMGYDYVLQEDGKERIHEAISDIIYRPDRERKRKPVLYNDIYIELPKAIRKQYDELEREFITELDEGVITAVNAAVKRGKLKQFCNGRIYDENKKIIRIHDEKIWAVQDLVDELEGEPLLIGYEYKHDYHVLKQAFPNAPHIGSGTKDVKKIIKYWNKKKYEVLIGQISVLAHGNNMQEGGYNLCFYSHLDKYGDVYQFIGRLDRQGQEEQVIVHRPIILNSVDGDVIAQQEDKDSSQKGFLNAMKKRIKRK